MKAMNVRFTDGVNLLYEFSSGASKNGLLTAARQALRLLAYLAGLVTIFGLSDGSLFLGVAYSLTIAGWTLFLVSRYGW